MSASKSNGKRVEVTASALRQNLARFLNAAAFDGERVIVSREGHPRPIAVVIGYEDFERLTKRVQKVA